MQLKYRTIKIGKTILTWLQKRGEYQPGDRHSIDDFRPKTGLSRLCVVAVKTRRGLIPITRCLSSFTTDHLRKKPLTRLILPGQGRFPDDMPE